MQQTASEIYAQTKHLSNSPAKVTMLEEAIRLADLTQDSETALEARDDLIDAANWSGQGEKALVAFAWILSAYDRKPTEERGWYDTYHTLWRYKWMFSIAADLPSIPLERIEAMFEDLSRRLRESNYGQRVIHHKRMSMAMHTGNTEEAQQHYTRWRDLQRDGMSDCHACEANGEVEYFLFLGDDENAVRKAKPLLEGRLTCHSVPTTTYANLLQPLLRLGRAEEAMAHHRKGIKLTLKDPLFMASAAKHLAFLALTGNVDAARKVFEKTVRLALTTNELENKFYYIGNTLTWWLLLEQRQHTLLTLTLPPNFPVTPADTARNHKLKKAKEYELQALRAWAERELEHLAGKFDARIGRPVFAERMQRFHYAVQHATEHPLETAQVAESDETKA